MMCAVTRLSHYKPKRHSFSHTEKKHGLISHSCLQWQLVDSSAGQNNQKII